MILCNLSKRFVGLLLPCQKTALYFLRNLSIIRRNITPDDRIALLDKLSTSTTQELANFGLSEVSISKIMSERSLIGTFNSLAEAHISGLDDAKLNTLSLIIGQKEASLMKFQELLQNSNEFSLNDQQLNVLNDPFPNKSNDIATNSTSSTNSKLKRKTSIMKKMSLMKSVPNFKKQDRNTVTFTALSFAFTQISWTSMNSDREILDMSSVQLLDGDKKKLNIDTHEFYEKILKTIKQVPKSEWIIFESYFGPGLDATATRLYFTLHGILLALFDQRKEVNQAHPLIILKKEIVTKLYELKVGRERKSWMNVGDSILIGKTGSMPWLKPISIHLKPIQKYILSSYVERRQMTESLLLVLAFSAVFVESNDEALALL